MNHSPVEEPSAPITTEKSPPTKEKNRTPSSGVKEQPKPTDVASRPTEGENHNDNDNDNDDDNNQTSNANTDGTANVTEKKAETGGQVKKISKNQLKRQLKQEAAVESKRRRKELQKNMKLAKAKAEGRDVDAERKDMEERRKDGSGWKKREEVWKERWERNSSKYQICLDCSFGDVMTARENNSLASQIRYCYSTNKRAMHPVKAMVTSLGEGAALDHLKNVSGFDQWANRAFHCTEKGFMDAYPDKEKLVYLTSDSENVLQTLEDDKVYIIGGIVDRNRLKRAAIDKAETLGIATAKLPIAEYLSMVATKVLTCNHVFEILIKYRTNGNDWKKAFLDVLPARKDIQEKEEKNIQEEEKNED